MIQHSIMTRSSPHQIQKQTRIKIQHTESISNHENDENENNCRPLKNLRNHSHASLRLFFSFFLRSLTHATPPIGERGKPSHTLPLLWRNAESPHTRYPSYGGTRQALAHATPPMEERGKPSHTLPLLWRNAERRKK